MSLLLALIEYSVTNGVLRGDGDDAFRDFMPEHPDDVIVFAEYSGSPVSPYTGCVHRSVQVTARSMSAEYARAKAIQLCSLFMSDTESLRVDFSDNSWGQVYVRQTPFKLSQDAAGRVTYCFNLGITTNILE